MAKVQMNCESTDILKVFYLTHKNNITVPGRDNNLFALSQTVCLVCVWSKKGPTVYNAPTFLLLKLLAAVSLVTGPVYWCAKRTLDRLRRFRALVVPVGCT